MWNEGFEQGKKRKAGPKNSGRPKEYNSLINLIHFLDDGQLELSIGANLWTGLAVYKRGAHKSLFVQQCCNSRGAKHDDRGFAGRSCSGAGTNRRGWSSRFASCCRFLLAG